MKWLEAKYLNDRDQPLLPFFTPFKKEDKVWLDSKNLKTIYHKKMKPKWEGPFTITEVLGPVTYKLQLQKTWRIHHVFMQHFYTHTRKTVYMGRTLLNLPQNL